ncbi:MAG: glycosyltransferase family 39 protein, partial [Deltaproteobacteria bacterium]|nr:glycosyltransferase family 39 protein [Deltaproteobacteria bacterium]
MEAARPVTTRAVVAGIGLGLVPVAVAFRVMPSETELPEVEVLQPLDLPIAAAALCAWLLAAVFLRLPRFPRKFSLPIALLLAVAPAFVSQSLLPTPVSNDERAYLFQAEMFAAGRVSLPLVEPGEMLRRRQIHEDPVRGVIYAKYPPGTAAALAPGTLVGLPSAMVALAGCLSVLLTAAIARRLGLTNPGLAALLFASCPLFLLLQTSFQSQVFTTPAVLAGYLALLNARADTRRAFGWGGALGVCSGWVFLTRPLSGLVFAMAMLPGLLAPGRDHRAPGLRAMSGAMLGGLPCVAILLVYNHTLTGNALLTPYALYAAEFSPWDVYPLFRMQHFADPSLAVLQNLFRQLVRWLPAMFGVLGAVSLGFWGLWRFRRRDGGAGFALALALPL